MTACDYLELTGCFFPKLETSFECEVTNTFTGRTSMINKRLKLSWFEANIVRSILMQDYLINIWIKVGHKFVKPHIEGGAILKFEKPVTRRGRPQSRAPSHLSIYSIERQDQDPPENN